jgi:hypothetical protein
VDANSRIERLVRAVGEGLGDFDEIKDALASARAVRDKIKSDLATMSAVPVLALHPTLAEEYRRNVTALGDLLADEHAKAEAVPRLRALIDQIVITPADTLRGVTIAVVRRIDEALRFASGENLRRAGQVDRREHY